MDEDPSMVWPIATMSSVIEAKFLHPLTLIIEGHRALEPYLWCYCAAKEMAITGTQ